MLADVAVLGLQPVRGSRGYPPHPEAKWAGRKDVGAGEYRLPPKRSNPSLVEHPVLAFDLLGFSPAGAGTYEPAAGRRVRGVHVACGLKEALAFVGGDVREEALVGDNRLEQLRTSRTWQHRDSGGLQGPLDHHGNQGIREKERQTG